MSRARQPIGSMSVQCAARELTHDGYPVTASELFGLMRQWGWISGVRASIGARADGFLVEREGTYYRSRNQIDIYVRTFVTGYGIEEIKRRIASRHDWKLEREPVFHAPDMALGF